MAERQVTEGRQKAGPSVNRPRRRRAFSFRMIIVVPLFVVLVLQACFCYLVVVRSDSFSQLESDTYTLFSERTSSRAGYLENDMVLRWSNVDEVLATTQDTIDRELEARGARSTDIITSSPTAIAIIDAVADDLLEYTQHSQIDGAYLFLTNGQNVDSSADAQAHTGLYVRDSNPDADIANRSDLLLSVCPLGVSRRLGVALNSDWATTFQLSTDSEQSAFYRRPFEAAQKYPAAKTIDLGYWGHSANFAGKGSASFTYSVPVKDSRGDVCGVLGIELNSSRITEYFPYRDFGSNGEGSYILGLENGSSSEGSESMPLPAPSETSTYEALASTGALQSLYLSEQNTLSVTATDSGRFETAGNEGGKATGIVALAPLRLYDETSPFAADTWVLMGLGKPDVLFESSRALEEKLYTVLAVFFVAGVLLTAILARYSSSRLRHLMSEVRGSRPDVDFEFTPTGVFEVDELAESIRALSIDVAAANRRLSEIMQLSNRAIAAFEYNEKTEAISYTDKFFDTIGAFDFPGLPSGIKPEDLKNATLSVSEFDLLMRSYEQYAEKEEDNGRIVTLPHQPRILRIVTTKTTDGGCTVGLVEDVTREIRKQRLIEHERDHDALTGLLGRRAFEQDVKGILEQDSPPFAAMVMLDLDNLKFMNDSYGHDWGDKYIMATAIALEAAMGSHGLCARISGDEFMAFVRDCDTKEEVEAVLAVLQKRFSEVILSTPDGEICEVRASIGIAFCPADADDFDTLRAYADFAMYTAKSTQKGALCAFDSIQYGKQASVPRS